MFVPALLVMPPFTKARALTVLAVSQNTYWAILSLPISVLDTFLFAKPCCAIALCCFKDPLKRWEIGDVPLATGTLEIGDVPLETGTGLCRFQEELTLLII